MRVTGQFLASVVLPSTAMAWKENLLPNGCKSALLKAQAAHSCGCGELSSNIFNWAATMLPSLRGTGCNVGEVAKIV